MGQEKTIKFLALEMKEVGLQLTFKKRKEFLFWLSGLKTQHRNSHHGSVEMNMISIHEDSRSIPGLAQ